MRRSRCSGIWLPVALALLGPRAAAGQGNVAGGAAFLLLPIGARATALGQAGTADAGTSESVYWNPAGLAGLPSSEFGVQYSATFASKNTAVSFFAVSQRLGTAGIAAYLVDYDTQDLVPPGGGIPTGRVAPKNLELLASYATGIGSAVSLGVTYKLIQFRQDCQGDCGPLRDATGTTHAVDVGVQVALGPEDAFRVGMTLQHAGFALQVENRSQADPLPTRIGLGAAYRLPLQMMGAGPEVDARIMVDVQNGLGETGTADARMGIEVGYLGTAYLRAGYAFLDAGTAGPSLGMGLRIERVSIDFARVFYGASAFDDPTYIGLRIGL